MFFGCCVLSRFLCVYVRVHVCVGGVVSCRVTLYIRLALSDSENSTSLSRATVRAVLYTTTLSTICARYRTLFIICAIVRPCMRGALVHAKAKGCRSPSIELRSPPLLSVNLNGLLCAVRSVGRTAHGTSTWDSRHVVKGSSDQREHMRSPTALLKCAQYAL